ncbi:MAG: nicotinamide riboside transporter PnuC [Bacteriovoracaceae bacterium]|nr:nicotinamide riboside transporter PnuC [Bacteroidota bacterium]
MAIPDNAPEIVAVILGLISVYLVTRQNVWCYPLGIISVFAYIFIFFDVKLYADMGLQVFFIVLQVYGWYKWLYGGNGHSTLHVSWASRHVYTLTAFFTVSATTLLGFVLHQLTDASLPYVDSFLAVLSMAAQWMMAKKYIENWILWTIVNIGSIGMYGVKGLYFTMFLYTVYFGLALLGYAEWKRSLPRQTA